MYYFIYVLYDLENIRVFEKFSKEFCFCIPPLLASLQQNHYCFKILNNHTNFISLFLTNNILLSLSSFTTWIRDEEIREGTSLTIVQWNKRRGFFSRKI